MIEQITVGVDPSGGKDLWGIVVAALLTDGRLAVLADRSCSGTPAQWGDAVVQAHDDYAADDVVVEINYGSDLRPRSSSRRPRGPSIKAGGRPT